MAASTPCSSLWRSFRRRSLQLKKEWTGAAASIPQTIALVAAAPANPREIVVPPYLTPCLRRLWYLSTGGRGTLLPHPLNCLRHPQHRPLLEVASHHLHADRQPLRRLPHGTLIPQIPARLAATEYTSARYIASGSSVFSPSLNAGVGVTGPISTSQRSQTPPGNPASPASAPAAPSGSTRRSTPRSAHTSPAGSAASPPAQTPPRASSDTSPTSVFRLHPPAGPNRTPSNRERFDEASAVAST